MVANDQSHTTIQIYLKQSYNTIHMQLGDKIRFARLEKKLSQEALARKVDISLSYLFKVEKNIHTPTFDIMVKIADTLGVSLDSLR
jgi:transcriptional regulator with XRE-family HTH domain